MGIGQVIFPGDTHIEERALETSTADFKAVIVKRNEWGAESEKPYTVTTEHPCILVGVSYVLPGDRSQRFTYAPFQIRGAPTHPGWDGGECAVPQEELTVRLGFMGGFVR